MTAIGDGGLPTNITQQAAAALIGSGSIFQSLLTGLNNDPDTANAFYLVGRNEDSGTRIGAYAESQFGVTSARCSTRSAMTTRTSARRFRSL
ncbi:MAG: hypothetical protein WDO13_10035 [Verrucomicrobiota bacterium]